MIKGEEGFISAILTQAVEDAKYTGINKHDIKHKEEAINRIMGNDPQFNYYCKLLNIEPSYIQNKIKRYKDLGFTLKQMPIVKALKKKYEGQRQGR